MTPLRFDYRFDDSHAPDVLRRCFDGDRPWTAQVLVAGGAIIQREPAPGTTLERLASTCENVTIRACDEITSGAVLEYVLAAIAPLADPQPDPAAGDVVRYREGIHDVALLLFHRRTP